MVNDWDEEVLPSSPVLLVFLARPPIGPSRAFLNAPSPLSESGIRGPDEKTLVHHDPQLVQALEALVAPDTRGDPMSPLRWTCKSTRVLARLLTAQGHPVSYMTVAQLLHDLHYSLQGNAKTKEGKQHPDRDAQFRYIQRQGESFLSRGWPVIFGRHQEEGIDRKLREIRSRMAAGRGNLLRWMCMISPTRAFRRRCLVASTTSGAIEGWVTVRLFP